MKTCQLMWENFVFLVIFDTCDVVYNWSISMLPPIVIYNLFAIDDKMGQYTNWTISPSCEIIVLLEPSSENTNLFEQT